MWTLWTGSCSFPEQRNRTKNHSLVSVRKKNSFRKSSQPTAAHPWVYNRLNYLRQVSSFTPSNEAHLVVTLSACNCKSRCGRQWSVAGSSGLQQMKDSIGGRSFPLGELPLSHLHSNAVPPETKSYASHPTYTRWHWLQGHVFIWWNNWRDGRQTEIDSYISCSTAS